MAGPLTRQDAAKIFAETLKVDLQKVYVLSLTSKAGTRDVFGLIYVYDNQEDAKKQLQKHLFLRMTPKEEKKKSTVAVKS